MTHHRIDYPTFSQIAPTANSALHALDKAVDDAGLDKKIMELVKLRASQINNCLFCIQFHSNMANKIGIHPPKLAQLANWQEAQIFSEQERAALEWTEQLTHVAQHDVSDSLYRKVREHFTAAEIVFLSIAIGTINHWNRLGVALRF